MNLIKRYLILFAILFSAYSSYSQVPRPSGLPSPNSPNAFQILGYVMDSAKLSVIRDTFPSKYPSLIRKVGDSAVWGTNGFYGAGARWWKLIDQRDTASMLSGYVPFYLKNVSNVINLRKGIGSLDIYGITSNNIYTSGRISISESTGHIGYNKSGVPYGLFIDTSGYMRINTHNNSPLQYDPLFLEPVYTNLSLITKRYADSADGTRVKYTDTSNMLNPYHAAFYNGSFDTSTRLLTLYPITGNPTVSFVIPRGGTVNGISAVTPSRSGNLLIQQGDNGFTWYTSVRDADSATIMHTTDTAAMLSPYLRKSDTATMLAPFVQYSDTSNMLLPYLRKTDTSLMLLPYLRKSDTLSMLLPYLRKSDTSSMLSGYARSGWVVKYTDTASMLSGYARISSLADSNYWRLTNSSTITTKGAIQNISLVGSVYAGVNLGFNSDYFTNPLTGIIRTNSRVDAIGGLYTNLVSNYNSSLLTIGNGTDPVSISGVPLQVLSDIYFRSVSNGSSSDSILTKSNGLVKSISQSSLLHISDTSAMLANRLKISDTATMLSGYARTGNSSITIGTTNIPLGTTTTTLSGLTALTSTNASITTLLTSATLSNTGNISTTGITASSAITTTGNLSFKVLNNGGPEFGNGYGGLTYRITGEVNDTSIVGRFKSWQLETITNAGSIQAGLVLNNSSNLLIYTPADFNSSSNGLNKLGVGGSVAIGRSYYLSGTQAPTNGLAVQGTTLLGSLTDRSTGVLQVTGNSEFKYNGEAVVIVGSGTSSPAILRFNGITSGGVEYATGRIVADAVTGSSTPVLNLQTINSGGSSFVTALSINTSQELTVTSQAGTGSRAVVADANGKQTAPVSDSTVKEHLRKFGYGIEAVMKLTPKWGEYKKGWKNYGEGRQNFLIAQDVQKVIPEAVFLTPATGKLGINKDQLDAVYVQALQDLYNMIIDQKNVNKKQEEKISSLEKEIKELKKGKK